MYKLLTILLFAYGLALTTEDIYDNSYALVIGINTYEKASNLDYAVEDATSIATLLIDKFNFPSKNVRILIDKEATLLNIKNNLVEISTSAKESDRVLIYFAGHGVTMDLPDGGEMGYLLPVDGKQDNLFSTSIPMDDLKKISSMSQAKHMLFLIDACYGGLAATGSRGLSPISSNYINKITKDKSRQIITAGGKGEKVIEKSEWGHSAFTMNLLRALENGKGDLNDDGYITADELGMFLQEKVTIDSENQQTPQSRRFTSHEGEFVFINNVYIDKQIINITSDHVEMDSTSNTKLISRITALEKLININSNLTIKDSINNPHYNSKTSLFDNMLISLYMGYSNSSAEELNQYLTNRLHSVANHGIMKHLSGLYSYGLSFRKEYSNSILEIGYKKMNYIDSKSNIYINFENSYYDEEFTDYNYSLYYTNFLYSILENPVKVYLGAGINL